ncbi:unnamed protein product [Pedinophyceae sp. YPF-701]|nr:unnamed protein product [Pedinophyceae sp. YPF-701]
MTDQSKQAQASPVLLLAVLIEAPRVVELLSDADARSLAASSPAALNAVLRTRLLRVLARHVTPGKEPAAAWLGFRSVSMATSADEARALFEAAKRRFGTSDPVKWNPHFTTPLARTSETLLLLDASRETAAGPIHARKLHLCGCVNTKGGACEAAQELPAAAANMRKLLNHDGVRASLRKLEVCCLDNNLDSILGALPSVRGIKELELEGSAVGGHEALLAAGLEQLSLQAFTLVECGIGEAGLEVVLRGLVASQHLVHMDVSSNRICDGGAGALAAALGSLPHLQRLSVARCEMFPGGVRALAAAVERHGALEVVNVSGNCVGAEGLRGLCAAVEGCATLRELGLVKTCIGGPGEDAKLVARMVRAGRLQTLRLGMNHFTDGNGRVIAAAVLRDTALRTLGLEGSDLADDAAAVLADVIRVHPRLEALSLAGGKITDVGARAFADAFGEMKSTPLRRFALFANPLSMSAAVQLGRAHGANPALEDMELAMECPADSDHEDSDSEVSSEDSSSYDDSEDEGV